MAVEMRVSGKGEGVEGRCAEKPVVWNWGWGEEVGRRRGGSSGGSPRARRLHALPGLVGVVVVVVASLVLMRADGAWTDSATVLSVMTGSTSVFPGGSTVGNVKLPASLTERYKQPESFHPNLRFWFTPDVFEELSTADNAAVSSWRNVANICHSSHASNECTSSMKLNGKNMAVEALKQASAGSQPVWKREQLNGRGCVRFARGNAAGTTGKFLEMHTTASSGTAGFTTNPFTSNSNSYTIFLVARTQPSITDTGDHGILNLALAAADATLKGLSIFAPSVTCVSGQGAIGLGCSGTACTSCKSGQYTRFGTLSALFGATPTADDNSCASVCSGGCDIQSPPAGCRSSWGPANYQPYQRADVWHVITIHVAGTAMSVYVDGHLSSATPPLSVTGETAASIAQMRLGIKDVANSAAAGFGSVDIAEVLVYDTALTKQEMDRVGNYLAVKFDLGAYRLNSDVGSTTRTAAVSKGCGCGSIWWAPHNHCSMLLGPYCAAGASLASGTCTGTSQELLVTRGPRHLGSAGGSGVSVAAKGGDTITISGYWLFPSDFDVQGAAGILGAASVAGVVQIDKIDVLPTSLDTEINLRYLAVAVASVPVTCRTPHGTVKCLEKDTVEAFLSNCRIAAYPSSGTNDASTACASWSAPSPKPSVTCNMPSGTGAGRDLVIYWHGVGTVLSGWVKYDAPRITSITPSTVGMAGGEIVTIAGENFGSQAVWRLQASGGAKTMAVERAVVRILGRQPLECRETTWVSDSSLKCEVPPVPLVRQPVDAASRTLGVTLAVTLAGRQSRPGPDATLVYTGVPAYFACNNNRVFADQAAQQTCFKCCRTACIRDAISSGSSLKGQAFPDCESRCSQYCGYSSRGKARRLVRLRMLLEWREEVASMAQ